MTPRKSDGPVEAILPPRIEHRRIGITLNNETRFRHIATLGAISDGGITVSPAFEPGAGWLLSEGTTSTPRALGSRGDLTVVERPKGLKLHYHRSGWTTFKSSSDGPQVGVKLRPMDTLHGTQIFAITQRTPEELGWKRKGPRSQHELGMIGGDAFAVVESWPRVVSCVGTVFSHRAVPWMRDEFQGESAPFHIIRGRRAYMAYDLRGHGLDAFLTISFLMHNMPPDPLASTSVVGMCQPDDRTSGACVRATSADGGHADAALPRQDMPQFPRLRAHRTTDRVAVTRAADGPGVFGEQV